MQTTAERAAHAAGKIILGSFGREHEYEQKEDKTFVSDVDRKAESAIRNEIRSTYPDHQINGEEYGSSGRSAVVWHVDPLDGTTNFKNGIPLCAVSIGIEKNGDFIIGVIYNPFTDEFFCGEKGKGAFCNDKPISVNNLEIGQGVHAIDASFRPSRMERKLKYMRKIVEMGGKPRMLGSNALQFTEVASGRCVSSLSDAIATYDYAAGAVIVREAGGLVLNHEGKFPWKDESVVLAVNSRPVLRKAFPLVQEMYLGYEP